MYAMVEIQGKQYKAEEGALLKVDHMSAAGEGAEVSFDTVLMTAKDGTVQVGTPYVGGAKVTGVVEGHGKDRKITVLKYKRRKNYSKKTGHRQQYSLVRVKGISLG